MQVCMYAYSCVFICMQKPEVPYQFLPNFFFVFLRGGAGKSSLFPHKIHFFFKYKDQNFFAFLLNKEESGSLSNVIDSRRRQLYYLSYYNLIRRMKAGKGRAGEEATKESAVLDYNME